MSPVAAPEAPTTQKCSRCAGENKLGIRYCVTCGNVLGGVASSAAEATTDPMVGAPRHVDPPPPASQAAPPPQPLSTAQPAPTPIMPMRVQPIQPVQVGAPAPPVAPAAANVPPVVAASEGGKACPRCRANIDPLAQFCRFCGAPLGAPAPAAKPTATDMPAPKPVVPATEWHSPAAPVVTPVIPAGLDIPEARRTGAPPPTGTRYGRIVIITKEGTEGASYPLGERLDIGRTEGEVIIGDDRYLSPRHARITRRAEPSASEKSLEFVLIDLASTNGIYLRLAKETTRDVTLEDQDLFLVGQQVLKFEVVRDAEEGLAPATQHGTLVFGTPATPRYARLSQRTVEGVTRDVFHVQKTETVLGREQGDIVFTDDPFLSRRHAAIKFDHEKRRFVLTDLGSSNGTFIQIRGQVTIKSGDQFRIGQQLFRVELSAAPAP
jgi:pSer/pThr/pTyr-binding forkhead associated (FHA) protein